ncbi:alpha/beta hydrolase [Thermonema rossianum]|uniref:alpha/beta hydrolase n=1 Tax=Thermonema rossianum TaxID=55505 RepID=UPI000A071FCD|nr:alpha/beta hydrolase [Thermonema rossianum]
MHTQHDMQDTQKTLTVRHIRRHSWQAFIAPIALQFYKLWRHNRPTSLEKERRTFEHLCARIPLPENIEQRRTGANGIPCEWQLPAGTEPPPVLFYVHGGGFVVGSVAGYRPLTHRLANATGLPLLAVDYSLAPEHPFPTPPDQVLQAYGWLITRYAPSQIIVMGDSAGANLALSALLQAKREGKPMPRALVLISPWADLTLSMPGIRKKAWLDGILHPKRLAMAAELYASGQDRRQPFLSPLFAEEYAGFPSTLIQVGTHDLLFDEGKALAERMAQQGVHVELEIWHGMPHVWHLFAHRMPEGQKAYLHIADFVKRHLSVS